MAGNMFAIFDAFEVENLNNNVFVSSILNIEEEKNSVFG